MDKKIKTFVVIALVLCQFLLAGFVFAAKPLCMDGIDNDGDGYTDYPEDPGCSSKQDRSELNENIECDDGIDNDGDGVVDSNDGGCSGPGDNDETNCGDGVCEGGETQASCPQDCGYPDSCSDTDGGNTVSVYGTTTGYYNNNPYTNNDYCVDSGIIMEYYCSGDYGQSMEQSCGTDVNSEPYCSANLVYMDYTDYFCSDGACGSTVVPYLQEDCDQQDAYGPEYCVGNYVYTDYTDYSCNTGSCEGFVIPQIMDYCNVTCSDGVCLEGNYTY